MNDQIREIEEEESAIEAELQVIQPEAVMNDGDLAAKRIIAEAMRHGGLKTLNSPQADPRFKGTYIQWLSQMVWDGLVDGNVIFADGTELNVSGEPKLWIALLKFVSGHLDGAVNPNAPVNMVNVFKVYNGIDPDRL